MESDQIAPSNGEHTPSALSNVQQDAPKMAKSTDSEIVKLSTWKFCTIVISLCSSCFLAGYVSQTFRARSITLLMRNRIHRALARLHPPSAMNSALSTTLVGTELHSKSLPNGDIILIILTEALALSHPVQQFLVLGSSIPFTPRELYSRLL